MIGMWIVEQFYFEEHAMEKSEKKTALNNIQRLISDECLIVEKLWIFLFCSLMFFDTWRLLELANSCNTNGFKTLSAAVASARVDDRKSRNQE